MKKFSSKLIAMIIALAMVMSMTSCAMVPIGMFGDMFGSSSSSSRHRHHDEDDDEDDDDEDDEDDDEDDEDDDDQDDDDDVDPNHGQTTSSDLTYPDHPATYDEIHPAHNPGPVTGDEAVNLLNEVERDVLQYSIDSYVDAYILFEDPSVYGIEVEDVSWGEIDYDTEAALEFYNGELEKLYSIDYESLEHSDRVFYDKVVYDMEDSVYANTYSAFQFYECSLNPLTGPQCDLLFILNIFDFETVEDAENYILLLNDIDRYYDQLLDYEAKRVEYGFANSDDTYEDIAVSFDNLVAQTDNCFLYETFETRLDHIRGLSDADRARLIDEHNAVMHDVVFPEFQECADSIRALKGSGGTDAGLTQFEGGDAYYNLIFSSLTNSSKTIDESIVELEAYIDDVMTKYNSYLTGDYSWYLDYSTHDYSKGDTQQNLDYLEDAVKPDFPALHNHSYFLIDVPKELEENFSPAAYLGYHLDDYNSNMIITNNANVDTDFGVTCAHEGYPGHMFQSVYTRSATTHPYMYIFDSTGYAEGWATYAENYSMKYFSSNEDTMTLVGIENQMNVLLMARCDIGIHYEGWDIDDCVDFFNQAMNRNDLTASAIADMYALLVVDPGYAIKYGVGYVNTCLVIANAHEQYPDATDIQIHTAYLNGLTGTFEQISDNMLAELEQVVH